MNNFGHLVRHGLFVLLLAFGLSVFSCGVGASSEGDEVADKPAGCLSSVEESIKKTFKTAGGENVRGESL